MKLKFFALLVIAFLPFCSFGQGAALTIFSEDGDKFTLFLNGAQQNNVPQTNLRIDGLTQQQYQAKIVFEDKAKGQVSKMLPVFDPGTNTPSDVVYKIKNKDGDMKIRFFSQQPVQPNYAPPSDVYVMHYGQPDPGTTVTQTTVTTTSANTNTNGGSISISTPGAGNGGVNMNVNMSFSDPNTNGQVTQTTTTTTTSSYSSTSTNSGYSNPQPAATGCQYPMDWSSFKSAKETISHSNFDDTKLSTAQSIINSNCISTEQVIQICQLFGFEENKLKFAKLAYAKTTDPGNYFKVGNIFSFDASKTELNDFISNGGR